MRIFSLFIVTMMLIGFTSGCGSDSDGNGKVEKTGLELAMAEKDAQKRVEMLISLSENQFRDKDNDGAKTSLEEAVKAAAEVGKNRNKLEVYLDLADAWVKIKESSQAGKALDKAKLAIRDLNDQSVKGVRDKISQLAKLAELYTAIGKRLRAKDSLQDALRLIDEKVKDSTTRARALSSVAKAYFKMGSASKSEYETAIEQAMIAIQKLSTEHRVTEITAIAATQLQAGDKLGSLVTIEKAVAITETIDNPRAKVASMVKIADHYANAKQKKQANKWIDDAEEIVGDIPKLDVRSGFRDAINKLKGKVSEI